MANILDVADLPFTIPAYFLRPPPLIDNLSTETSEAQQETVDECLPLLGAVADSSRNPLEFNEYGVPDLRREDHIAFLEQNLSHFPSQFVGLDASRPWMVYWGLTGLYLLGADTTAKRQRVKKTFFALQNPTGGFGGGHGHDSHLAATYAALLSIASVGGDDTFSMIDREAMWHWLGRLKQPDGGFQISEGGEQDARGALCALVIISLLNLPLDLPTESPARAAGLSTFNDRLGSYISKCQTYEGGISASPGGEAHGAYAFCAIACLCLLGDPQETLSAYLDIPALLAWLSSRQYAPEGGLAGRTNKLVDGCYSHWIGGCWPLVQAALNGALDLSGSQNANIIGHLYGAEGLARYILCCCQGPDGGLRDKPSKRADSYHTCYTLTGVSNTEHFHYYDKTDQVDQFDSAFSWKAIKTHIISFGTEESFDDGADLPAMNPVYAIPHASALDMRKWYWCSVKDEFQALAPAPSLMVGAPLAYLSTATNSVPGAEVFAIDGSIARVTLSGDANIAGFRFQIRSVGNTKVGGDTVKELASFIWVYGPTKTVFVLANE